jgi:hypothetical protein
MKMKARTRRVRLALAGGAALLAVSPLTGPSTLQAHAAGTTTVVTIQFDDGVAD